MRFVCELWCINCVPVLAWGVGQGSGERWRRWRLPEGSRGGVWKTRSCRGGAILQVGLIKTGCDMVPIAHYAQFLSLTYLFIYFPAGRGKGSSWRCSGTTMRKKLSTTGKRLNAYRRRSTATRAKSESWSMMTEACCQFFEAPTLIFPKSMITGYWLTLLQLSAGP